MDAPHPTPPTDEAPEPPPTAPEDPATPKPKRASKAAPSADRPPGRSLLPVTRVQKILKADKELPACAKEAVFLLSVATEEFVKRLGQAGHQQAVRAKRTTVQPRDVAAAVRRADEFAFLEEILSAAPPAAAPAAKRKQRAAAPASDTLGIAEAFGKSKEGRQSEDAPEVSDSGERQAPMDVS